MILERVAVSPGIRRTVEPRRPFSETALHLQYMGDRVDRPEVVGVDLEGLSSESLCGDVVAALLIAERQHA